MLKEQTYRALLDRSQMCKFINDTITAIQNGASRINVSCDVDGYIVPIPARPEPLITFLESELQAHQNELAELEQKLATELINNHQQNKEKQ